MIVLRGSISAGLLVLTFAACGGSESPSGGPSPGTADGGPTDATTAPTDGEPAQEASTSDEPPAYPTGSVDTIVSYTSKHGGTTRALGLRIHYPKGTTGEHKLVFVSHGGFGAANGEALFDHLGVHYASIGLVAVQLGHRPTPGCSLAAPSNPGCYDHYRDRADDVSQAIDAMAAGTVVLPDFAGTLDTSSVAHIGHSAGAFTSLAVAGARYPTHDTDPANPYRDPRVKVHGAISPQGVGDFFEADEQTWAAIEVPSLVFLGGDELDVNGAGTFIEANWRLVPWTKGYWTSTDDRILLIVPGQEHAEMAAKGSDEVKSFIAQSSGRYFDYYLRGRGDLCSVGKLAVPAGLTIETSYKRKPSGSALAGCP